jgi:hypothetical protein
VQAAHSGADADAALAEVQGQRTQADAFSERKGPIMSPSLGALHPRVYRTGDRKIDTVLNSNNASHLQAVAASLPERCAGIPEVHPGTALHDAPETLRPDEESFRRR